MKFSGNRESLDIRTRRASGSGGLAVFFSLTCAFGKNLTCDSLCEGLGLKPSIQLDSHEDLGGHLEYGN